MTQTIYRIESRDTNPYRNLALEEYLLTHVRSGECILYLWQNRNTVVIGRNQNSWKECRTERLEEDGGYLARRLSGGGAVYHDLGNLNFTFIAKKEDFDVEKQTEVILRAVQSLGIRAERTGRNDLVAEGRKFSGHAYYQSGDACYHHGTVLIHVDTERMSRYLNVSREKLLSKSVSSVKSRVVNLDQYIPDLTVCQVKQALLAAFEEVYGQMSAVFPLERLEEEAVSKAAKRFASWEWKYGRKLPFDHQIDRRFDWGEISVGLKVNEGVIRNVSVYSDMLDTEFSGSLKRALEGVRYRKAEMEDAVKGINPQKQNWEQLKEDMISWFREMDI